MKKSLSLILALVLACACLGLTACGEKAQAKEITIAVPNDTSNEARALLLLEALGFIEVDDKAGIVATVKDITSNPKNIKFQEVEAAQLPNILQDVDYAVINGNYAIPAGLKPADALGIEGSASPYANILVVKEGNENNPLILALKAALESKQVQDYIKKTYPDGSVVTTVDNVTDGYDSSVDYAALSGQTISCAATPAPHAEILENVCKDILAAKGITLKTIEYTDYVQPNLVVEDGEVDCNYFQHDPYLDEFNAEQNTHLKSIAWIHCEPMGLFGGKQTSLDALK